MLLESIAKIERSARRLQEIVSVLTKYGLADWLGGLKYEWLQSRLVSVDGTRLNTLTQEARIRLTLTELGTTFVKLGQILSTRPDLLPEALVAELSQLQANTPPDSGEVVRKIIQAEFGQSPEELFAEFDFTPIASASIGQVHQARLKTGQPVAVKIQHDDIEDRIQRDLHIMAGLAELLEKHVTEFRAYKPAALVRRFRRTLMQELDFTVERRNIELFASRFADDETVHFPAVYPAFCSRRVLTMELLDGILGTDHARLAASEYDLNEFARRAANMYVQMIFHDGVYHADPHPGNYMVLPGGVVGVLDCGMTGRLDETLREDFEALILCFVDQDARELANLVVRLGSVPANLDFETLRADVSEFVSEYGNQPLSEFDLSSALTEMTGLIRRYHIALPTEAAVLLRTLVILEGSARQLSPQFSLIRVIQSYYERAGVKRFMPQRFLRKARRSFRDWDRLLISLPNDLSDLLRRFRNGSLEIHHEHRRLETTINHLATGILVAALFLGSANLLSNHTPPLVLGVSALGMLGIATAVYLGIKLLRVIHRENGDSGTT